MTWFKVDDSFHSHPKVIATDPAALGLWVVAGSWCGLNLTDGYVPDKVLPRLVRNAKKLAVKLVDAGLWIKLEDGYQFHDWADRNPSSDKVKQEREASAERQRKWRENKRGNATSHGVRNGVTNTAPTRPDPSLSRRERGTGVKGSSLRSVDEWCGECDERTRHVELADGRPKRCPACHPQRETA